MDYYDSVSSTLLTTSIITGMIVMIISLIAGWKIFTKARKPGWAVLIPIYNILVLLEIVGRPTWWLIFFFIPGVDAIFFIIVCCFDLAKVFGKSGGFGVGLLFLNFIFMLILAFDDTVSYIGPIASRPEYLEGQPNPYGARPQTPPAAPSQVYQRSSYASEPARRPQNQTVLPPARASKPKVAAWLIDSNGHAIQLYQGETTLGKLQENDIQVSDTTVSRRHAKINERNGHFTIVDLGSTNGTKVNGHLINSPYSLAPDDEIRLGDNSVYHFKA